MNKRFFLYWDLGFLAVTILLILTISEEFIDIPLLLLFVAGILWITGRLIAIFKLMWKKHSHASTAPLKSPSERTSRLKSAD